MALVTGLNAVIAFRLRPAYRPVASQRPGVETYRLAVDPHRRLLLGIVLALVGLISGLSVSGAWRTWLLFANQVPFGQKDPQFKLDISFFVFTYPFIRLVLGYLFAAVLLSLVMAVVVHALYGGLRLQGRRVRATTGAQTQLFILVGAFVLLKGVAYWFDRYGIDFSQRGTVTTGASYTDVNAVLPAKTVLAVIAILCAVLFFAGAVRRSAMLPAVGFGLLVLSAILIGGVYPAVIQQFVVKPNELAKESKYIAREIKSTRLAYDVDGVRVISYPGAPSVPAQPAREPGGGPGRPAADGPGRDIGDVPAAPAGQGLLPVPRPAGGGPLRAARRRPDPAGPGGRGPRDGRPAPGPGQLDQHPPGLHARLRVRGRQGGGLGRRRHPGVRGERHTAPRPAPPRPSRGCTSGSRRTPTRSSAGRPQPARAGTGLPGRERQRPAELHLHGHRRRAGGLPAEPLPVRRQVPRAEHPAVRRHQQLLEDPLRPAAARPGGQGGPVPDPGRQPVPGGRERAASTGSWTATPPPTCIPIPNASACRRPPPPARPRTGRSPGS